MLQMKNIHKAFGQNKVLTGVDFILKEASVHALMGENGAGKSTLMKILVGIHGKDEGQIMRAVKWKLAVVGVWAHGLGGGGMV